MGGPGAKEKSLSFAAAGCCLRFDIKPTRLFYWDQSVCNSTRVRQQGAVSSRHSLLACKASKCLVGAWVSQATKG